MSVSKNGVPTENHKKDFFLNFDKYASDEVENCFARTYLNVEVAQTTNSTLLSQLKKIKKE